MNGKKSNAIRIYREKNEFIRKATNSSLIPIENENQSDQSFKHSNLKYSSEKKKIVNKGRLKVSKQFFGNSESIYHPIELASGKNPLKGFSKNFSSLKHNKITAFMNSKSV